MQRLRSPFVAALAAIFALTLMVGVAGAAPSATVSEPESETVVTGKVQFQDIHFV